MTNEHQPIFKFTPKEVLILVQAITIAKEDGGLYDYAKSVQIEALREKLQGGGR